MEHSMITHRDQLEKKILDTIEIGEIKFRLTIANEGEKKDYYVLLGYRFSYDEKQGELTSFSIQQIGFDYEKANFPVGENIADLLGQIFKVEWPTATNDQRADMISEVIEFVQGQCQRMLWQFFMKMSEYEDEKKARSTEACH
jgi:hypothetical protein